MDTNNSTTPATHEVYASWDDWSQSGGSVEYRGTKAECTAYAAEAGGSLIIRAVRYTAAEKKALAASAARAILLASFGSTK